MRLFRFEITHTLVVEESTQGNASQTHMLEDLKNLACRSSWQEYSKTKQEISRRSFRARHVRLATPHILLFGAFWVLAPAGDDCHGSNFMSFNEQMVCPADVWQIWNSRSSFDKKTMCFGLVLRLSSCNLEQRAKRIVAYINVSSNNFCKFKLKLRKKWLRN